jgi:uncharacterized ferredoxin-like protein
MSIIREQAVKQANVIQIAQQMMIAARTAPKAKGKDSLEMMVVSGDDLQQLAEILHRMGDENQTPFYHRDADNLLESEALFVIGTRINPLGLNEICQLCGFENCAAKEEFPNTPCVFNVADLNIALGSALSLAADFKVDNRVMFSLGKAVIRANIFESAVKIAFGIPLSVSSKNPFFDRPLQNK